MPHAFSVTHAKNYILYGANYGHCNDFISLSTLFFEALTLRIIPQFLGGKNNFCSIQILQAPEIDNMVFACDIFQPMKRQCLCQWWDIMLERNLPPWGFCIVMFHNYVFINITLVDYQVTHSWMYNDPNSIWYGTLTM